MVNPGTNYQTPRIDQPISETDGTISRSWWNYLNTRNGMIITSGDGAPTTIPKQIGDEYLDLTNKKLYKGFGVTDVSDWILIN